MFIQLLPDQIMNNWDDVRPFIEYALPPLAKSDDTMVRIQENLLIGQMQCWVSMKDNKAIALVTTKVVVDECSITNNLLIYTIYVSSGTAESLYLEALEVLRKYAESRNCSQLIAYSNLDAVIEIAENLGADVSCRFITFGV